MLRLDLGCGGCQTEGFIGVDRFPLNNVDIIADLDKPLPFETDSVDLLYASHSLEHVADLMTTMREIYRICKHGAQICIVAPYNEQKLSLANPYHAWVFNEHTPRFWTEHPETPVDSAEYEHPHTSSWGLSRSDHSDPGIDIRLVRMEFFYFPEYRHLSNQVKRRLRSELIDVCDQIMYHLIVWKDWQSSDKTFADHLAVFEPFVPKFVLDRRESDHIHPRQIEGPNSPIEKDFCIVDQIYQRSYSKLEMLYEQLDTVKADLARARFNEKTLAASLGELKVENQSLRSQAEAGEVGKAKMILLRAELEAANGLVEWYRSKESSWTAEMSKIGVELDAARQDSGNWVEARRVVNNLFVQVCGYRSSRLSRLMSIFSGADQLWNSVSPAFAQVKSYTEDKFRRSSKTRLILGDDLRSIPFREYRIPFSLSSLSTVSLAVCPLLPTSSGSVGIEIVSAQNRILAQTTLPMADVNPDAPTHFKLPVVGVLEGNWALRAFVRETDVPVALYEMVNCTTVRRRANFLPFVSFH